METLINNIKVNYIDEGKGTPVIFLQGWGTNIDLYYRVFDKLKQKNRIVAFDFPGFGKTPEPDSAWNVDNYVDFLESFLEKLKIKKAILMGHSFGGRVIIKYMSRKDRKVEVEKIVLLDSAGIKPKTTPKKQFRQKWYKFCKKVVSSKPGEKLFPGMLEKLQNKYGSADYRKATPLMKQVLVKTVNEDLTDLLPNINCPTLLVWGDLDTATPLSDAKLMEEKIPDAGLVVLKNTGHYSFLEDFYTFSKVMDVFLNGK